MFWKALHCAVNVYVFVLELAADLFLLTSVLDGVSVATVSVGGSTRAGFLGAGGCRM